MNIFLDDDYLLLFGKQFNIIIVSAFIIILFDYPTFLYRIVNDIFMGSFGSG